MFLLHLQTCIIHGMIMIAIATVPDRLLVQIQTQNISDNNELLQFQNALLTHFVALLILYGIIQCVIAYGFIYGVAKASN